MTTGIGAGVGGSITIGNETTFGTYAAPTRALEFESESLEWKPNRTRSKGIYNGGFLPRNSGRHTTSAEVSGDIVTPVYTKGMGLWLGLIFGTMGITPVQQAATAAYLQTHVIADNSAQSATIQVGRPSMDRTINPYTYLGNKVTKAVFEAKVDEPLRLTLSIDGKDVTEAQGYVAPTFQTANAPLWFDQGTFTMGTLGSEAQIDGVRGLTLTIERKMRTDRKYMNGTGRKSAQIMNDYLSVTGDIETDFVTKAAFADLFYADTPQSIIVPFTGAIIASTFAYGLTFKMPRCNFNSEPPKIGGLDIIQPKMQFEVEYDDTNTPMTCTYMSTDITL